MIVAQDETTHKLSPTDQMSLLKMYFAFSVFYGAILNGRVSRAYKIVKSGLVSRLDENTYLVTSSDGQATYTVTFNPTTHEHPGWQCTCPDCHGGHAPVIEFGGGVQPTCKHIVAIMLAWTAQVYIPRTEAKPAPVPARINGNGRRLTTCDVCKRDWQECDCPTPGNLPEPARITTLANAGEPLAVAEQKQAARNANGIKQEAGRRTSASLAIRHW